MPKLATTNLLSLFFKQSKYSKNFSLLLKELDYLLNYLYFYGLNQEI